VVIDGDNLGVANRKRELDEERLAQGLVARSSTEPVAIFVPTWSIETWLVELCGRGPVSESVSMKDSPARRVLWELGRAEAATLREAVAAWRRDESSLASLGDAYGEAARFGI
jgi:hypothetical protein